MSTPTSKLGFIYEDLLIQNTPFSAIELEKKLRSGFQPSNKIYNQIMEQSEAHWENLQDFIKGNIGNTSVHRDTYRNGQFYVISVTDDKVVLEEELKST